MAEYQKVRIEESGDITVVHLHEHRIGEALEIEALGRELNGLAEETRRKKILLDFSNVESLSSLFLGKLISLSGKLATHGAALRLCNIRPPVLEAFLTCKFDRMFDIRTDAADALAWA